MLDILKPDVILNCFRIIFDYMYGLRVVGGNVRVESFGYNAKCRSEMQIISKSGGGGVFLTED